MKKHVINFFKELELYEDQCNSKRYKTKILSSILEFLKAGDEKSAYEVYASFFKAYWIGTQKEENPFLKLTEKLRKYEESAGRLIDNQRDHYVHSVNVFLLGLAIFSANKRYRDYFDSYALNKVAYPDSYDTKNEEFFYRWGLASLFHDIGYPLEITLKQANKYFDFIWCYPNKTLTQRCSFIELPHFKAFIKLPQLKPSQKYKNEFYKKYSLVTITHNNDCVSMLAEYIANKFELKARDVKVGISKFIKKMEKEGFIDHGFYGAVIMSRWYYYLLKTTQWNPAYFYFPILDAASAIVLHNFYKYTLIKKPFNLGLMKASKHPIAYLLILCDDLQNWNRRLYSEASHDYGSTKTIKLLVDNEKLNLIYSDVCKRRKDFKNSEFVCNVRGVFKNGIKITKGGKHG